MKWGSALCILIGLLPYLCGGADKRKSLTFHPILSIPTAGLHLSYEFMSRSGRIGYEIPLYLGYNEYSRTNPILVAGAGLGVRRYLFEAAKGTYVSPQLELVSVRRFSSGPGTSFLGLISALSVRMGYKFLWEYFTLDMGLGATYLAATALSGAEVDDDNLYLLIPSGNLALGIPF